MALLPFFGGSDLLGNNSTHVQSKEHGKRIEFIYQERKSRRQQTLHLGKCSITPVSFFIYTSEDFSLTVCWNIAERSWDLERVWGSTHWYKRIAVLHGHIHVNRARRSSQVALDCVYTMVYKPSSSPVQLSLHLHVIAGKQNHQRHERMSVKKTSGDSIDVFRS